VVSASVNGSFRIVAQDSSRLTATVTGSGVTLAIDTNADGDDGTISNTWTSCTELHRKQAGWPCWRS